MENPLNDRLVELHHEVAGLKVYDADEAFKLKQYADEFNALLTDLLAFDNDHFGPIKHKFELATLTECKNACDAVNENGRMDSFYNGVEGLNSNINHSLTYFSRLVN